MPTLKRDPVVITCEVAKLAPDGGIHFYGRGPYSSEEIPYMADVV